MSIATDIRNYADTAVSTGRQAFDAASAQARASVAELAGRISGATGAVQDLRASAEKAVNVDAITSAVEPYLAQLRQYSTTVTDKVEDVVNSARSDKRINQVVTTAESLTGVVVTTVNARVVKPVIALTGRGTPSRSTRTSNATNRPAARKATPTKATTKPANKPAARKSTARKTTARKTTARTSSSATSNSN